MEEIMAFELPPLKYAVDALEPFIDAQTVEIHFTKHHATYLKNLNAAIEKHPELFDIPLKTILSDLSKVPEDIRQTVRNMGGGVYNHNVYWTSMAPGQGGEPVGKLASAINQAFGSFSNFKVEFEKAALGRFGSGYCWLSKKADGSLLIHSTANQDTPMTEGLDPIIVIDVWEHAYYLKYQNRRNEYISNWWSLVNWQEAENRYR
jgi:superoxide dismutase, Fe-Mn family